MLVVAVGAIAAGTFGPVYLGEADHSVLLSTLAEAPVGNNGITLLPSRGPDARTRLLRVSDEASHLFGSPTFGGRALLGSPIVTEDIGVTTTAPTNGQLYGSDLVARTDVCRHLYGVLSVCAACVRSLKARPTRARSRSARAAVPWRPHRWPSVPAAPRHWACTPVTV